MTYHKLYMTKTLRGMVYTIQYTKYESLYLLIYVTIVHRYSHYILPVCVYMKSHCISLQYYSVMLGVILRDIIGTLRCDWNNRFV